MSLGRIGAGVRVVLVSRFFENPMPEEDSPVIEFHRSIPLRPLSRAEVRQIDVEAQQRYGLPTVLLMENAARGATDCLITAMTQDNGQDVASRAAESSWILLIAGPGNNGGDAAAMARLLDLQEIPVEVLWLTRPESIRGDAALQRRVLDRAGIPQTLHAPGESDDEDFAWLDSRLAQATWIVDGLFGTGLTRPISGWYGEVISRLNKADRPILALDLPSGLDADSGEPLGIAVEARMTATFVAPKLGFVRAGAYTGKVRIVDIGAPRSLLEPYRVQR